MLKNNMKNKKCKKCGQSVNDSIAIDLELCQTYWEEELDKSWWKEIEKLEGRKNNMLYQKILWFLIGAIITFYLIRNIKFF
jgi:threonine synthase